MKLFTATAAALLIAAPANAEVYRNEFVDSATATVTQCDTSVYRLTATTRSREVPYHIWRAGKEIELNSLREYNKKGKLCKMQALAAKRSTTSS